ncbi:MAG TPA: magnesium/cobalt transporter CorA, partial [bacterium]|nr:magnesium/cobalt transporter CorA [bacterium]
ADPNAPPPQISVIAYDGDQYVDLEVRDPESLRELRRKFPVTWVNVNGLGDSDLLELIGDVFGLHRLALEDVINVGQRPKVEDYGDHLFLVTRMPLGDGTRTEQAAMFLGKDFLLTFQETPGDPLDTVRSRIREGRPRIRAAGPDYLAYAVLDAIVDAYFPVLDELGDALEGIEEEILSSSRGAVIADLHNVKRELTSIRRVILPVRESLGTLFRDENPVITEPTRLYLRDVVDHSFQVMELAETYRDTASGLIDLHLTLVSNRMNDIMKVLTIIATIFIPLGFIAGLYGMNFDGGISPWNMPELRWPFGYPFALGLMAAVAGAMVMYFRRKDWL